MGFPFKTQKEESCAARLKTACQLKYCDMAEIFNQEVSFKLCNRGPLRRAIVSTA